MALAERQHREQNATRQDLADTETRLKRHVDQRLADAEGRIVRRANNHTSRKIDELADTIREPESSVELYELLTDRMPEHFARVNARFDAAAAERRDLRAEIREVRRVVEDIPGPEPCIVEARTRVWRVGGFGGASGRQKDDISCRYM